MCAVQSLQYNIAHRFLDLDRLDLLIPPDEGFVPPMPIEPFSRDLLIALVYGLFGQTAFRPDAWRTLNVEAGARVELHLYDGNSELVIARTLDDGGVDRVLAYRRIGGMRRDETEDADEVAREIADALPPDQDPLRFLRWATGANTMFFGLRLVEAVARESLVARLMHEGLVRRVAAQLAAHGAHRAAPSGDPASLRLERQQLEDRLALAEARRQLDRLVAQEAALGRHRTMLQAMLVREQGVERLLGRQGLLRRAREVLSDLAALREARRARRPPATRRERASPSLTRRRPS